MIKMTEDYAFATKEIKTIISNSSLGPKKEVIESQIGLVLDFVENRDKNNKETRLLSKNIRSLMHNKNLNKKEFVDGVNTMLTVTNLALYC